MPARGSSRAKNQRLPKRPRLPSSPPAHRLSPRIRPPRPSRALPLLPLHPRPRSSTRVDAKPAAATVRTKQPVTASVWQAAPSRRRGSPPPRRPRRRPSPCPQVLALLPVGLLALHYHQVPVPPRQFSMTVFRGTPSRRKTVIRSSAPTDPKKPPVLNGTGRGSCIGRPGSGAGRKTRLRGKSFGRCGKSRSRRLPKVKEEPAWQGRASWSYPMRPKRSGQPKPNDALKTWAFAR